MKKLNKIIAFLLGASMLAGVTGCKKNEMMSNDGEVKTLTWLVPKKEPEDAAMIEEKLNESDLKNTKFQKTINRLKKDLKAKNAEIAKLYKDLESKNFKIDSLLVENQIVGQRAAELTALSEAQLAQLNAQDVALHTAYFFMGTRKELRANDINVKDKDSGYRTSLFTPIDVRTFDRLATDSKSAKILTKHPEGSYELTRGEDKKYTLVIKNPTDFWNASKYLIIQVK